MLKRLIHEQSPTERPRAGAHRPLRRVLAAALCACLMLTLLPTAALAAETQEQFTGLTVGETYYFDLSGQNIPGTVNSSLPNTTLHYVPFTYAGTVNAYSRTTAGVSTDSNVTVSPRSLFIADYNVTHTVSWDTLNTANLIFGKNYTSGGVTYKLRTPSMGSSSTGSGDNQRGDPVTNEWDQILNKNVDIKSWSNIYSWGQETYANGSSFRVYRGYLSARSYNWGTFSYRTGDIGFRPVLEVLGADTLGSDGLCGVTLNVNGGTFTNWNEQTIKVVLKSSGGSYTAPSSTGITPPEGLEKNLVWNTAANGTGTDYAPGASVPSSVTTLYARYAPPKPSFAAYSVRKESNSCAFTLRNKVENATYTLYDSTGNNIVTSSPAMEVTGNTLKLTNLPAVDGEQVFYVSVKGVPDYTGESDKTKITVMAEQSDAPTFESTTATFTKASQNSIAFTLTNAKNGATYRVVEDENNNNITATASDNTLTLTFTGKAWERLQLQLNGSDKSLKYSVTVTEEGKAESSAVELTLKGAPRTTKPAFTATTVAMSDPRHVTFEHSNTTDGAEYEYKLYTNYTGSTLASGVTIDSSGNQLTLTYERISSSATYYITARDVTNDHWESQRETLTVTRYPGAYVYFGYPYYGTAYVDFHSADDDSATATANISISKQNATGESTTFSANDFSISSSDTEKTAVDSVTITSTGTIGSSIALQITKGAAEQVHLWYKEQYVGPINITKYIITPPTFETSTTSFETTEATAVTFTLTNPPEDDSSTTYKVYAAAEGGSALTDPKAKVSAKNGTLTLTFTTKPTEATNYYISAKTGLRMESKRTEVTVSPYVAPTYGVTLAPSEDKTFTAATVGYGEQSAHSVTVNNSGNQPTGALTVALSGDNASSFTLSTESIDSIAVGGNASFTVVPNTGLTAGTYTATVTVSGSNSISASFAVSFTVNSGGTNPPSSGTAPTITTTSLANGTVGTAYSATLAASGTTPITWSVSDGSLPAGLELNTSTGVISGTPTTAGTSTFTVKASNGTSPDATKQLSITISAASQPTTYAVTIASTTNGTVAASATSAAANTEITLTVTPASGYVLDALTVYKTGDTNTTVPVSDNKFSMPDYNVTVSATFKTTGTTPSTSHSVTYTLTNLTATDQPETVNNNAELSATLTADSGYKLPDTITVSMGGTQLTVGEGYTYNSTTGVVGITSVTGDVVITASGVAQSQPPQQSSAKQITAFTIENQVGETAINQESHTIAVTMPSGTTVTSLTPTITVSEKASVSPQSGTAQDFTNSVTYTVTAEDNSTQTYTVTVTVQASSGTAPTITTESLSDGTVGTAYSATLAASGTTPITWSVSAGSLPGGLSLSGNTISGTPTTAGTFSFTVKAVNTTGEDTQELSITISAPEATVTSVAVTPATANVKKGTTQQFSAVVTGENDPEQTVTWTVEGDHAGGTSISEGGLLTVASDETATTLTVKAVSNVDDSKSATATVTVTDQDVTKYGLTVTDGNGSGEYEAGAEITVTAETKANKRFKEWTASGITLSDATENPITITMPSEAVTLTATYDDVYAVTVTSDSNGTATASPATAAQGDTVTLTATANSGYQFKEWTVISGGITLDADASTSFTMPNSAVEVKAIFEEISTPPTPTTYTITFNAKGGTVTPSTAQTNADGRLTSLPTPTRSNYRFDGWFTAENGGTQVTANTVFSANDTIYAHWSSTSTGSGGGGNNNSNNTTTETTKNPDGSTTTTTTDKKTGTVTETTKAPDGTKTVVETKKDGTTTETVSKPDGTETETVKTPEGKVTETLKRPDGVKTETTKEKTGEVTAKVTLPGSLSAATVTLPVEDAGPGTVAVIVHADGTEEIVKKSINGEDGLTLTLEDSATLKIVDNSKQFKDVPETAWYAEAAEFASSRELFQGTAPDTFSPGMSLNRGMFVTVLYRLENEPDATGADFSDVKDGAYYEKAVAWAAENSIVAGIGNGQYAPGRDITRQELAAIIYRYAGHLGLDLSANADLGDFQDGSAVSGFAQDPMKWCVANGIIGGKGNGVLDPGGNATRAEAVSILMRFVNLLVK